MKKLLIAAVILALSLASCQQMTAPPGDEGQESQAIAAAEGKTAELVGLVIAARATRDFTELDSFLSNEDSDGQVRALLETHGVFGEQLQPKAVIGLPEFGSDVYQNGDVLVCKGSGGVIGNLMEMILVRGYAHAGILNKDFVTPPDDPYLLPREREAQACVLSADVDYLQNYLQEGNHSLTYETYAGWSGSNDVVTVLRLKSTVPTTGMYSPINALYNDVYKKPLINQGGTVYAFLGYAGTPYRAFEPIPRQDSHYWYCSKVAWRVFAGPKYEGPDIERADFYFINGKWTVFKDSLLYKLYVLYLIKCGCPLWRIPSQAKLKIQEVLTQLITPDELRASMSLDWMATYGNNAIESCWSGYGGW